MQKYSTVKYCSLVFCILVVFAEITSSVPFYSDDENDVTGSNREKDQIRNKSIAVADIQMQPAELSPKAQKLMLSREKEYESVMSPCPRDIRDLYELLLKKKTLDDQLNQTHQIARKSNRSPSLRLRFGKKRDPYYANPPLIGHPIHLLEDIDNL